MENFGDDGVAAIARAISELDPEGKYVRLDPDSNAVWYAPDIRQHEDISRYEGEEEPARAYIVAWLCTVGGYLPANIELETRYSVGRPKAGAELDILLRTPDGTPYGLIEVKAPGEYDVDADKYIKGQLFDIAPHEQGATVLAYCTVSVGSSGPAIVARAIDYATHKSFDTWCAQNQPCSNELPTNYGEPIHVHYARGTGKDLRTDVTRAQFDRLRKRLHDVLWKGSRPDNLIYAYVVKLFLAKIHDEKTVKDGERYRFQVRYTGSIRETPEETFKQINDLYAEAYRRYLDPSNTGEVEKLNDREFSAEQTAFVVELLQGISITRNEAHGGDLLGTFFEGITREGFKQSKGLFFTHVNIVVFILKVLGVDQLAVEMIKAKRLYSERLPYIIDPSCGSGTFLLGAMQIITDHVVKNRAQLAVNDDVKDLLKEKFPKDHENQWAKDFLFGIEYDETLATATKVNMVLRRDGNTHVYNADGLAGLASYQAQFLKGNPHPHPKVYAKPVASSFDVVISNPPFSITLDPSTKAQLDSIFELAGSSNSENLFLERWYQLLKPKGRLGVVLPESFFSTQENLDARLFLFAHFNLRAVVALPKHAFEPWTPTRTALLFAQKKTHAEERSWSKKYKAIEEEANLTIKEGKKGIIGLTKIGFAIRQLNRSVPDVLTGNVALPDMNAVPGECEQRCNDLAKALEEEDKKKESVRTALRHVGQVQRILATISSTVSEANEALKYFDLTPVRSSNETTLDELTRELNRALADLSAIDPRLWAFERTVAGQGFGYKSASVENIGYKRTKRAEYERRNDLFRAAIVRDGVTTRIGNLAVAPFGWEITTDDGGDDLLSDLLKADLWR